MYIWYEITMKYLIKARKMKLAAILMLILILVFLAGCNLFTKAMKEKPLQTVGQVDLNRYLGKWYEIARYAHRFQKGCASSMATYSFRDDGKISVLNECREESTGKLRQAEGKAWVVDKVSNAKLKVSFFWPFSGDYWIIDLGKNYEYAVIGHPGRKYLWILSRTEKMEQELYENIISRLDAQGYDTTKLIRTDSGH